MKLRWPTIFAAVLLTGCATYQPRPITPEGSTTAFDARSLTNAGLRAFLETNHFSGVWDLNSVTLAAFYYQPALAEARAQWAAVRAAEITAAERPNPSVSFTPAYDTQIPENPSPWILPLDFDLPIETAGKREKRISQAKNFSEAARWDLIGQIWQARSHIRTAMLALYTARENESLLAQQESTQSNVVRLLEGQLSAGSVSSFEVTQARVALENAQLAGLDAAGQYGQARAQLAGALGVPLRALDGVEFSFADFNNFPRDLTAPEVRRQALFNRADVRGALADYAASQSALQLEIANQYPDVHLGPGYAWNNGNAGDNQWSLGATVDLPVLNHNEGGVAEAKAKRELAAAHFLTVQASAISEIDSALAGYDATLKKSATAQLLQDDLRRQLDSVSAQAQAGELDPLALANARVEYATGAQNQLSALMLAQQSLGRLEDAMQSPLTLPAKILGAVENQLSQGSK